MKKLVCLLLAMAMLPLTACANTAGPSSSTAPEASTSTEIPQYF